jgi:transposase
VSTQPEKIQEFFERLKREHLHSGDSFLAVVEVCGFNDWLLEALEQHQCHKVILIQPEERKRQKNRVTRLCTRPARRTLRNWTGC